MLSFYFVLIVTRKHITNERISKCIEPTIHLISIVFSLILALNSLSSTTSNDDYDFNGENSTIIRSQENEEGCQIYYKDSPVTNNWMIPTIYSFVTCTSIAIYLYVRKQKQKQTGKISQNKSKKKRHDHVSINHRQ